MSAHTQSPQSAKSSPNNGRSVQRNHNYQSRSVPSSQPIPAYNSVVNNGHVSQNQPTVSHRNQTAAELLAQQINEIKTQHTPHSMTEEEFGNLMYIRYISLRNSQDPGDDKLATEYLIRAVSQNNANAIDTFNAIHGVNLKQAPRRSNVNLPHRTVCILVLIILFLIHLITFMVIPSTRIKHAMFISIVYPIVYWAYKYYIK